MSDASADSYPCYVCGRAPARHSSADAAQCIEALQACAVEARELYHQGVLVEIESAPIVRRDGCTF